MAVCIQLTFCACLKYKLTATDQQMLEIFSNKNGSQMNTLPPPRTTTTTTKLIEIEAMQKVEANLKIYNYYCIDEKSEEN